LRSRSVFESAPAVLTRRRAVNAAVAQLVERVLGKDEVMGSIPISSFKGAMARDRARRGLE
jgi:hypothetical protein